MKYFIFFLFFLTLIGCNSISDDQSIHSINIYKGPYRELMSASNKEDLDKIENIVKSTKLELNYADSLNGLSLLNWCIVNDKRKSFEKLLKLGADPNWQDTSGNFPPPIIEAAGKYTTYYLELCLKYKGNKNLIANIREAPKTTPLLESMLPTGYMENTKMLVKNGVDINLVPDSLWSPLIEALIQEKVEIALYLLNNGADYNAKLKTNIGTETSVLQFLRQMAFPLNSNEYKIKMKIVSFLQQKGLNYWKQPIPREVLMEHKSETEYLSKY